MRSQATILWGIDPQYGGLFSVPRHFSIAHAPGGSDYEIDVSPSSDGVGHRRVQSKMTTAPKKPRTDGIDPRESLIAIASGPKL